MTETLATTRKAIAAVVMCSGLFCAFPVLAERYEVGPGRAHAASGDVPWETLSAGEDVLIYWTRSLTAKNGSSAAVVPPSNQSWSAA